MKDNIIRVHFDGLDKHSEDLLVWMENYQIENKLSDKQLFLSIEYVFCSLFALFLSEKDLSSEKFMIKKITKYFDEMMTFLLSNREGFKEIIKSRG